MQDLKLQIHRFTFRASTRDATVK